VQGNPLVTICLFAYNQAKFVDKAVASALTQTYTPLEIIISDDCSTDSTFEIIKEKASRYKGTNRLIIHRNDSNLGIALHVNQLISRANGELIVMMTGDDISVPTRVEQLVNEWMKVNKKALAIYSSIVEIDETGMELGVFKGYKVTEIDDRELLKRIELPKFFGASAAYVTSSLRGVSIPADCVEDLFYYYYLSLHGSVLYIKDHLVKYRLHSESASTIRGQDFVYREKRKTAWLISALEFFVNNRQLWAGYNNAKQVQKITIFLEGKLIILKIKKKLLISWLGRTVEYYRGEKKCWHKKAICEVCRLLYRVTFSLCKLAVALLQFWKRG
jgi:glycosyltransferase involved in cell wall biosynthesis